MFGQSESIRVSFSLEFSANQSLPLFFGFQSIRVSLSLQFFRPIRVSLSRVFGQSESPYLKGFRPSEPPSFDSFQPVRVSLSRRFSANQSFTLSRTFGQSESSPLDDFLQQSRPLLSLPGQSKSLKDFRPIEAPSPEVFDQSYFSFSRPFRPIIILHFSLAFLRPVRVSLSRGFSASRSLLPLFVSTVSVFRRPVSTAPPALGGIDPRYSTNTLDGDA